MIRNYQKRSNRRSISVFGLAVILLTCVGIHAQPEKLSKSFAQITKRVEPAVVSIDTKGPAPAAVPGQKPSPSESDDVMDFLRRQMQQRPVRAVGSGFVVDKDGYIMTNAHVIAGALRIVVKLDSGEEFPARVVGTDEETDLAVLKIDPKRELPSVRFADSDKAEVGDWVLALGSPFGLAKTVTAGIISQTQRETPYASAFQRFIQTDAAINRGNSGGPLVNMDGEVVGVNSQIATSTGDYNGVGFALPSREAEFVFKQIVANGKVRRGFLGVLLDSVKAEYAAVYGLKDARGAIVTDVRDKQGPAGRAGLQAGDIVVEFDNQPIGSAQDLIARVAATSPDQNVTFTFLRETGNEMVRRSVTTKLGERPVRNIADDENANKRVLPVNGKVDLKPFGLTLVEMTPTMAASYKLDGQKALIVKEINPAGVIADIKTANGTDAVIEGDLIKRINRVNVTDLPSFNAAAAKLKVGDPVVLHVLAYNPANKATQLKIVQFTVR
jgi:serine protease Do